MTSFIQEFSEYVSLAPTYTPDSLLHPSYTPDSLLQPALRPGSGVTSRELSPVERSGSRDTLEPQECVDKDLYYQKVSHKCIDTNNFLRTNEIADKQSQT